MTASATCHAPIPGVTQNVFMFSGQGSQYFHMGRALFDGDTTFRQWMLRLDDVAARSAGESVIRVLYSESFGKSDPFDRIRFSHPAIFMVEYSLAQCLIERGILPDYVLGVSLGSFAAAAVAGYVPVEDALRAVGRQASAIETSCEPGGMIAVLSSAALYNEAFLNTRSELAALNLSTHFVVSTTAKHLATIEADLKMRDIGYQRLPVCFAFHSRWIDGAKARIGTVAPTRHASRSRVPIICCEQAATLTEVPDHYFWNVVRRPIRFADTVLHLAQAGDRRYIDLGPSGTLATFLKYSLGASTNVDVHAIMTPYGSERRNMQSLLQLTNAAAL